jgi:hypothetical protein
MIGTGKETFVRCGEFGEVICLENHFFSGFIQRLIQAKVMAIL